MHAGPLFGALGILAAVIRARETGEGSQLEIGQSEVGFVGFVSRVPSPSPPRACSR
jgi:crotonobetainyl-CoA:carnitine CoA-transferase CaiB-like acyl-CoA transferase